MGSWRSLDQERQVRGKVAGTEVFPAPSRPIIEATQISHWFQGAGNSTSGVRTLEDVSLAIGEGEFVSIIGPSGCGKTTLLNIIAGFVQPQSGNMAIDGDRVQSVQVGRVAYMFARDMLLPWRTALQNVELAISMRGRRSDRKRCVQLLELVGLHGFMNHYPQQLSQGMRQRVALARTLAVEAAIWLMDEPFGALDAHTKTVMQTEFTRIWERSNKTVVFVTHDLIEAILLSDRVLVMSARPGRIQSSYEVDLPRPRNVMELHSDERFLSLYKLLWQTLRSEFGGDVW